MSLAYFSVNLILGIFVFFFFHAPVFAVTIDISSFPSLISTDQFSVTASVSGAQNGTNYLRIDLYKEGTSNYFGETYNGQSWYGGSSGNQYLAIAISGAGSASANILGRLGSPSSTDFSSNGQYKLRIRRYTNSGNPASGDTQNPVDVQIIAATPTPTQTPVSTSTPTSNPTPTKTPSPSPTPTQKPTISSSISPTNSQSNAISPTSVLGESTESGVLENSKLAIGKNPTSSNSSFPIIFIVLGIIFIMACAILAFWQFRKSANLTENE